MKRIEYIESIMDLFEFRTMQSNDGDEFVLFKSATIDQLPKIEDKTEFEALENHIHLLDNVRKDEYEILERVAKKLGTTVLDCLMMKYPQKHFRVYITIRIYDSMIIRFHQIWENEEPYYNVGDLLPNNEKVYVFEN
jgi:hypothetical protein